MADIMSIPSEIKFKEMLSHTFPGFFFASSLFMLIDYLSPDNLTAWAIGSLANLVIFAGFIIIIGTILGVIIDGIHHTFIEDDIFDNFKAIHQLKQPIKEQLKANCPSYSDNLSRHFFLSKIGEKGANANTFETLLDEAYYRYSEFYSNIFVSLVIFSIISPFYIFEVLELSWMTSVSIGIASILTACFCLKSSYTSYTTFLKAQSSAICGFIKVAEAKCITDCNDKTTKIYEYDNVIHSVIIAIISWICPMTILVFLVRGDIIAGWPFIGLIIILPMIILPLVIYYWIDHNIISNWIAQEDNVELKENKKVDNSSTAIEYLELLLTKADIISKKVKEDTDDIIEMIGDDDDYFKGTLKERSKHYAVNKIKGRINYIIELIRYDKKNDPEAPLICNINERVLFRWNVISENNKERLMELLDKTIKEFAPKKSISMVLNEEKTKVTLKIDEDKKDEFIAKAGKNDELIIYKKPDLTEKLSKSSPIALISFISSLLLCMIILATTYTPINLNIEPPSIKLNENIANNTTLKNPVETITLRNLGDGLDDFSLSLNGIANNWLEIRYINDNGYLEDKSNNLSIASGETKFIQIKLNSSGMDRANISQGSYIGSIDIDYSNRLKSIPLCINLTKK